MARTPVSYVAISRSIFEHPLLNDKRTFSRLEAWQWLIIRAAWKATGARRRYGVAHVERGQIATTIRELAAVWGWPHSSTERFLQELAGEEMVRLGAVAGTKMRDSLGIKKSYKITLLTLCNYDKYQVASPKAALKSGTRLRDGLGQEYPDLLAAVGELQSPPDNHKNQESSKRSAEPGQRTKPSHGARGKGMVWLDHGSMEWNTYAENYREVLGVEKLPETREGGRGNWFRWLGEKRKVHG